LREAQVDLAHVERITTIRRLTASGVTSMNSSSRFASEWNRGFQVLWEDGEHVFCRGNSHGDDTTLVLAVLPASEHPAPAVLDRLAHEYGLKEELDGAWAVRPLELIREGGRTMLVLEDPGGEPLERLLGAPLETDHFLRLAIDITVALGKLHRRGLLHKDIKPANIMVNCADGQVRLTGFGIASRVPRERQAPEPPETIAGTLAYMAPEQTGRMNRSIDSRSDLYALGVTFYQMLTGSLPFKAADPMEWVHCHIARKPLPPSERLENIPAPVSEIIMKLLAKTAEERYQTAAGVESDLRHCLAERERKGRIDPFAFGEHDAPDRLLLPEKLYGRAREIETLLACFDRIVNNGAAELVLVSGYSGIGKSSVVNELHKALVPSRGLFASGKFDQYKRDIPYSTLAQAFQSLIRPLLAKSDPELAGWREAFREALGPNGQLIIDLVPELKLIVGEQPPVPELPPHDAQRRFQLVFRRFLAVFARPEHPLALFLDDLQWLDSATLDLLEDLLTQPDVQHLMLIGAYRDNEVNSAHPLIRKLEAIGKVGAVVHEIILAPLAREDLGRLIGDALHCAPERVTALAELIHEKTAGNPFFANQLISVLVEEGLLTFDYGEGRWSWDLNSIRAQGYTDNVADFMAAKLSRLPPTTQKVLGQLACLGNAAESETLALVHEASDEATNAALWEAVRVGLVLRSGGTYAFLHDRVQEAAYTLIVEDERAMAHLRIGRLLAARTPPEHLEENIFDIVNQFDRGAALISTEREREQVATFNLMAGKRAKAATAYAAALRYFVVGRLLLGENGWEQCFQLTFDLELNRGECEYLTGELVAAEERFSQLSTRARTIVHAAAVTCVRINLYTTLDRSSRAVEVGLGYLRRVDARWPQHATAEDVQQEYDRLRQRLGSGSIERLLDLPLMTDPDRRATMDVLTVLTSPALFTDLNLFRLVVGRMASLSLEYGNSDGSSLAYAWLGGVLGTHFGDYQAGYRFGKLGLELVEKRGLDRFRARVYLVFAVHVAHWTQPLATSRAFLRRAFEAAQEAGDLSYAAYSCIDLTANLFASGAPLDQVERVAEIGMKFAKDVGFGLAHNNLTVQFRLVRMLRGLTLDFGSFNDATFDESRFVQRFDNNRELSICACWYWIRKLQAGIYVSDSVAAIAATTKVTTLLWTTPTQIEQSEYQFYGALAQAARCDKAPAEERSQHLAALADHSRQIAVWAENCPENFENRVALVGAEIARIDGRVLDAEHLYEQAIRSARANGFIHNEALAYELAARFYAARGFKQIADLYMRNARYGYLRWGAVGKVRQLDETYPDVRQEDSLSGPTSTIGAPVEHLDLATVIKVSQAVSGEIALESLIDRLMHTAMEQAGAERALLIMPSGKEPRIEAEATTSGDTVTVRLVNEAVTELVLPESVLHYVLRTREIVILDDAAAQSPFGVDSYIRQRHARSILCLPLLNRAKLIGVLYLENNLTPRVFAPARISVLKLLASQAAIALENAHLYRDVAERETKIRRLVDSNIIGIFIWDFEGRVLEANDEFLRMVDYDREDLVSGRIRWTDLTPPDWRERDNAKIEQHKISGRLEPFEKEYTRRNGSRVPVLIGVATFEEGGNEGVAFVLDLTDRKRAEEKSRESELKLRQIIETVPGLVWSNGPDGEPTHVNKRMLDYSGMSFEEFGHRGWEAFVHPADYPETAEAFWHAIQNGTPYQGAMRLRRADGEFRWHHARSEPLCDRQGRIIQWYGLCVDIDERKKAEDQLRRSEVYLAEAQKLSHSGTAAYNETAIFYWSDENYRIFGFDPREGLPSRKAALERIHPDDRERAREEARKAVEQKKDYTLEFRILLPGGTVKYTELKAHPKFSASGELVEVVGTIIDVTERTHAEQALRESEEKFRDYAETASDWFWEIAPDYKFTLLTEDAFGSRTADRIGTTIWDHALDLETEPDKWRLVWATLDSRKPFRDFVYRGLGGNGSPMYVKTSGKPVFDANGEFRGYRGTGTDVTAIMRTQEALRESERSLRSAIDGIPGLVAVLAPNGEVESVNRQLLEYFGQPLEWLKNWGTNDAVHPEDLPRVVEVFSRAVASGLPFQIDQRQRCIDGEYRWFETRGVPIRDDSGRIARWYVLLTDIEDRTRALARLEQMQLDFAHMNRVATMGQLTASITHEVNQPITAAVTYALAARRFLSAEPPNFREVDDALSLIVKEGNRAGEVVERVRALIKKVPARKDAVAIDDAILEVIALTRTEAANNSVSVRTQFAEGLPRGQGDRVQLQQVMLNLIVNAIQAMSGVGEGARELQISIDAVPSEGGVRVGVQDTGPGLSPESLSRLFEPFYTTKPEGMGMGLSICRSIIEAHGGRLWAIRCEPQGALFQFTIPATRADGS
jgi:PAS domain S-box-containing protein